MSPLKDGFLMGDERGRVLRVFAPPAWKLWRWVGWLLLPRATRETRTIELLDERGAAHPLRTRFVVDAVRR